ncbi:MAG: STAS/SEC14 domain-containing protein [Crocosphaera sp.]|nr:STAS/SEC14 domain-containing protein [Crocosphaera sp.]
MIKLLKGQRDSILLLEAEGKVTGDDYQSVVIPALENKLKQHQKICLLYELGNHFSGFDFLAIWEDFKLGLTHWSDFEKIALVSDIQWIRIVSKVLGFILPYPLKVFHNNQLSQAEEWVSC